MADFLIQLATLILVATIFALIAQFFKQSTILAYVIAGIILGPMLLNLVSHSESLHIFQQNFAVNVYTHPCQIGISLLLFIVGISLNPKHIKEIGKISLITGTGQIVFTFIIGFFISKALGFTSLESAYISIALTISSTIIIIKLLTDKNELDTLHGRIAVGLLLIQDFLIVITLVLIGGFKPGNALLPTVILTILKALFLLLGIWLAHKILVKHILNYMARHQELLFLGALSWCFAVAVASIKLGFSFEVGAFLAGLSLSKSDFGSEITSKIRPLRDFFIAIFFINLGISMIFSSIKELIFPIIIFSLFILIGNPLVVYIIMTLAGYRSRTSFLTGLTVAQISEFSLILMALGLKANHVSNEASVLVTTVGIITITASTYLILYGDKIYNRLSKVLVIFERNNLKESAELKNVKNHPEILLFGCHRMGYRLIDRIRDRKILVVDFNPDVVTDLIRKNINVIYADIKDNETLENLSNIKWGHQSSSATNT